MELSVDQIKYRNSIGWATVWKHASAYRAQVKVLSNLSTLETVYYFVNFYCLEGKFNIVKYELI